MTTPIVVQIVVDKPLPQGFDYLWDEAKLGCLPQIGHIVEIPFGRGKEVGIVTKVSAHSEYEFDKLRSIEKIAPLPLLDGAATEADELCKPILRTRAWRNYHA